MQVYKWPVVDIIVLTQLLKPSPPTYTDTYTKLIVMVIWRRIEWRGVCVCRGGGGGYPQISELKKGLCHILAAEEASAPQSHRFHVLVVLCSGASVILF